MLWRVHGRESDERMSEKPMALALYDAGYTPLVSVIPPNAPLSPFSTVQPSQRGKSPGRKNKNGTWGGYGWLKHPTTRDDVKQWAQDGANIGILATNYPGVDIDSLDPDVAAEVRAIAREILGPAPCRTGRAPKCLLMYRAEVPFARMAVIITMPDGSTHLVEVLGDGRQYLIQGQHPSGARYTWDQDIIQYPPKVTITREMVNRFFDVLEQRFGAVDATIKRLGDGSIIDRESVYNQHDLAAPSIEALRECVALIPNTDDVFPSRDDYIKMGYAIRAAAGAEDEDGYEIFASWAARHESDGRVAGNPDTWRSDWRRMQPPYAVGWSWLSELAARFGFNAAQHEFTADAVEAIREQAVEAPPEHSDPWCAERVIEEAGHQLRYAPALGRWFVWDGGRWAPDATLLADTLIQRVLNRHAAIMMRHGATDKERILAQRVASSLCSAHRMREVRSIVRADPRVAVPPGAFDNDPWLLNTPGGAIDLKTGEMREPDPRDLCSRRTSIAPDYEMPAPVWEKFLREVTAGDIELQAYLQRLAGYALTGLTVEQIVAFIWGPGGNGKSVFINVLSDILGDYAERAPMDAFTATGNDRHPTDLAGLAGARLVVATETQGGRRWDEQRLKALTGGDPIRARFMRQDFFTFLPQFLLMIVGNHKPEIRDLDDAIRRRIHLVPFTHTPPAVDPALSEKLRAEYPAILAWMVLGCLQWQYGGLAAPPVVRAATEEYFADEDPVGRWIEERCEVDPSYSTSSIELFRSWEEWANARNEFVGTVKRLTQLLTVKHFEKFIDGTRRRGFKGLRVREEPVV